MSLVGTLFVIASYTGIHIYIIYSTAVQNKAIAIAGMLIIFYQYSSYSVLMWQWQLLTQLRFLSDMLCYQVHVVQGHN